MFDPGEALAHISTAITIVGKAVKLAKSITGTSTDPKSKEALQEMQENLTEVQGTLSTITATLTHQTAENYRLQTELNVANEDRKRLAQELKARPDWKLKDGIRWYKDNQQPFCGTCTVKFERDIPLAPQFRGWRCNSCPGQWTTPQPPDNFGIAQKQYERHPSQRHVADDERPGDFDPHRNY
jgi:hypothetical protein